MKATAQHIEAMRLLKYLVREWYAVDGTSASDLLDEVCEMTRDAGIVTKEELARYLKEESVS